MEVHNFEMAERINKQITGVSSRINALRDGTKLGDITHGILMQPKKKTGGTLMTQNVNKPMYGHNTDCP